ncbi:MAG: hypothetical protein NZL92_06500 [Gloeomargarita sp. SKYG116]|nr:hypothetical protein [Gloeomargarita sp. SKYG116]MCS7226947.1 hypothetical protein [Gloeomargarita sp. SKYB31]MDW8401330.1 hypothetical protein [Gloeomargarita sp. SKYGB_i_bin116]
MINRILSVAGRLFTWIGQLLGAIFTVLLVRPVAAVLGLFGRRSGQPREDKTFFLDPEEAKSLGKRSESPAVTAPSPQPAMTASPVVSMSTTATPAASVNTNRRRPGPNMSMYLEMAKQMRRA